jgi:hypothetical protein
MRPKLPSRELVNDQSGAVFVEHLIVFVPTMFFFLATMQTILLCTGDLVIRRAASVAARAAVVVLPDDPLKYEGVGINEFSGARRAAIIEATRMILEADPHFDRNAVQVSVSGASGVGPLTATVTAPYRCFASFVNLVCGGSSRQLRATSWQAYQGANYAYE